MSPQVRKIGLNLLIICGSIVLSLGLLEVLVRSFGTYDESGTFAFADQTLRPFRLPLTDTAEIIAAYQQSSTSRLMYDPTLGWSPRPNSISEDGLYHYNSVGIRSGPTEYTMEPEPGVLRIALFGDSYTHGDDVTFEDSWGYYLEKNLQEQGISAEVINFGVSGYGIDQAYLRWQTFGREFDPDIVILGFDAENVNRNMNLIRAIYKPGTGLPFAKPRFLLDGEALQLINVPVLSPEGLVPVLKNIEGWDLAGHEYFLANYRESIWVKSKLVALALTLSDHTAEEAIFTPDGEPAKLTLQIIHDFRASVEADGRRFLVLHLPRKSNVETITNGQTLTYAELMAEIAKKNTLIDPTERLVEAASRSSLSDLFKGHYSPEGNQVIGNFIADYLISSGLARRPDSS